MAETELPTVLAKPAQRALADAGISSLEQLCKFTEAEILALHGMGKNAMSKLQAAMETAGLKFTSKQPC